jgi:hypothetical protein
LISALKNKFKTTFVLNQTETAFIDFKRGEFPDTAKEIYDNVLVAYRKKDKVDLMKSLSGPLYDVKKFRRKNKTLDF